MALNETKAKLLTLKLYRIADVLVFWLEETAIKESTKWQHNLRLKVVQL